MPPIGNLTEQGTLELSYSHEDTASCYAKVDQKVPASRWKWAGNGLISFSSDDKMSQSVFDANEMTKWVAHCYMTSTDTPANFNEAPRDQAMWTNG